MGLGTRPCNLCSQQAACCWATQRQDGSHASLNAQSHQTTPWPRRRSFLINVLQDHTLICYYFA